MSKEKLWTKSFVIISIVNLCIFLSFQMFPTVLPVYMKELGASDSIIGWQQGALTIAAILIRPYAGHFLDKYGRKGILAAGIIGMLLVTSSYMIFTSVTAILIIRFSHGLVWGVANTACSTVATDNIERTRFAEGMSYFSLTGIMALAVAPSIALYLGMQKDIILAVGFLILALVLMFFVHYPKHEMPAHMKEKKIAPYAKEAILPSVLIFLIMTTYGAIISFIALFGEEKSIQGVGLFFTVYAVGTLVTRPYLGKLIDKKGFGVGIWPGVILIPISLLLLTISSSLILFLVSAALFGVGVGAAQSSLQAMALISVPRERTGAANATFFTAFDGGIGAGSVMAGIISGYIGYGGMYASLAVLPIISGIIYVVYLKVQKSKSGSNISD